MQSNSGLGLVEQKLCIGGISIDLPERCDVVQHPERPPMRGCNQIIAMDVYIVNRNGGKVQLEPLPANAVIDAEKHSLFGGSEEQPLFLRVLANGTHIRALRNATCDHVPALAVITRNVDVRTKII